MTRRNRYIYQWVMLSAATLLGGLSAPGILWREDEAYERADNFQLDARDDDDRPQDGVEEAFERVLEPGRLLHDVKNIGHEWVKRNPKGAYKIGSFVIVVLTLLNLWR